MAAAAAAAVVLSVSSANAQNQQLTLCWAAWDPANALAEVSKDFTAESGIQMNFEFVPWTNFADRFLNELNSQGKLCDLMIGDSQWLGTSATNDHYVKLNEFFDANGIDINDFLPATVYNYSTWPKGEPEYWALPAMGDALAWIYRKDWFERPEIQEAFQAEYGRALQVPQNWDELLEIAKFFQGREIDGKTRYGVAIYTERGSEDITMEVTSALYQVYGEVLEWAAGRPVIIRTLDAGGDKPIAGLTPEGESNPFLGLRGLRHVARPAGDLHRPAACARPRRGRRQPQGHGAHGQHAGGVRGLSPAVPGCRRRLECRRHRGVVAAARHDGRGPGGGVVREPLRCRLHVDRQQRPGPVRHGCGTRHRERANALRCG